MADEPPTTPPRAHLQPPNTSPRASTSSKLSGFIGRRAKASKPNSAESSIMTGPISANSLGLAEPSKPHPSNGRQGQVEILVDGGPPPPKATSSRFAIRRKPSKAIVSDPSSPDLADEGAINGASLFVSSTSGAGDFQASSSRSPPVQQSDHLLPVRSATSKFSEGGGDAFLPRRLSGWFSNVLHSSGSTSNFTEGNLSGARRSTASLNASPPSPSQSRLSSPKKSATLSQSSSQTPPRQRTLAGLDRMLDKAVNYFLDTDSNADKSPEDIWLLGVSHEGWRPSHSADHPEVAGSPTSSRHPAKRKGRTRGSSISVPKGGHLLSAISGKKDRSDTASNSSSQLSSRAQAESPTSSPSIGYSDVSSSRPVPLPSQTHGWPPVFFHDFASQIQLTYRSGFPPIPCAQPQTSMVRSVMGSLTASIGRGSTSGLPTLDGLTSDSGWGCMLRTGQTLLANALVRIHLGRDWRRNLPSAGLGESPPPPPPNFATYARLLTWFFDDPSPMCPFSVHRFALKGKELGKEVGEWFGPSTAAGAVKALASDFPPAHLGVVCAIDGSVYKSDVIAAARDPAARPMRQSSGAPATWSRPVLILINLRLGIDGVNPVYHESIKSIFTFSQTVGIAGGRPSSSYYFLGYQGNSLIYIDPHHPKPSVPLKPFPVGMSKAALEQPLTRDGEGWESVHSPPSPSGSFDLIADDPRDSRVDVDDGDESDSDSNHTWRDARQHGDDVNGSPAIDRGSKRRALAAERRAAKAAKRHNRRGRNASRRTRPQSVDHGVGARSTSKGSADPLETFFAEAYTEDDLRSFHCERVRKMPLTSLDPSMLVGFLCESESDWEDLNERLKRVAQHHKAIVHVAERPPAWIRSASGASNRVPSAGTTGAPSNDVLVEDGIDSDTSTGIASFDEPDDWELSSAGGENSEALHPSPALPIIRRPSFNAEGSWDRSFDGRSAPPISSETSSPFDAQMSGKSFSSEAELRPASPEAELVENSWAADLPFEPDEPDLIRKPSSAEPVIVDRPDLITDDGALPNATTSTSSDVSHSISPDVRGVAAGVASAQTAPTGPPAVTGDSAIWVQASKRFAEAPLAEERYAFPTLATHSRSTGFPSRSFDTAEEASRLDPPSWTEDSPRPDESFVEVPG